MPSAALAMQRNVPRCSALPGMTKTQKKKKKTVSARPKASNKPKHVRSVSAVEQLAKRRVPTTEVEAPPRVPFVFWPLEVMKWWMPSTNRS